MDTYSAEKYGNNLWRIWQHTGEYRRVLCFMTPEDVLKLFNEVMPQTIEAPFLEGDPECTHAWRPWSFNNDFVVCSYCPAMKKVKRLVPKEYK